MYRGLRGFHLFASLKDHAAHVRSTFSYLFEPVPDI